MANGRHPEPLLDATAHDDRVAARLGELVAGRLAVVGPLSPALLRGLLGRVRTLTHHTPDRAAAALLGRLAARAHATDVYVPVLEEDSEAAGWSEVDGVLVVSASAEEAEEQSRCWLGQLPEHAVVVALIPAGETGAGEVPCPDPSRAIHFLRRRPPTRRRPVKPPAEVSVVIPTYNRTHMLPAAVDSALDQDPPPAEVLIADDGSTEDVEAALRRFGDRVRLLRLPHRNMAAAQNAALQEVSCPLVAWLDDDDLFLPGKLALQLPTLDDPAVGFSATAHYIGDPEGVAHDVRLLPEFRDDELLRLLLRGSIFLGPTVLVRLEAYDSIRSDPPEPTRGPYDEGRERAADYDVWFRLARHWRVRTLQIPLTIVRRHPGNPLDEVRGRHIFDSVQSTLRWVRASVPLEELYPPSVGGWRTLALLERARASLRVGLFEGARADLLAARANGASPVRIDCLLGLIELESGSFGDAQACFERAVALGGDDPEALNGLGTAQLLAGGVAAAVATFRRVAARAPTDPLGLYNLGIAEAALAAGPPAGGSHPGSGPSPPSRLQAVARDLLARRAHRSALYSPDPPLLGIDRLFAAFRRRGPAGGEVAS